ncbi:hypothetical protein [Jatrophihabitans fulvus]
MFRRRRAADPADPAVVLDGLRAAVARLEQQRSAAAEAAGRAFVSQAEVTRICTEQLAALAAAFGVAEECETTAVRAARAARDDADPSAEDLERTVEALRASQQVLGGAAEPIHALLAQARDNTAQAREVLARSRAVLDEQIRAQLRALQRFERAEMARAAAAARERRR